MHRVCVGSGGRSVDTINFWTRRVDSDGPGASGYCPDLRREQVEDLPGFEGGDQWACTA